MRAMPHLALAGALAFAGAPVLSGLSATPAFAAKADLDLIQSYVGNWRGRGPMTNGDQKKETVVCRLEITRSTQEKIGFSGRCALAGGNLSMNGTMAYIVAANRYEAIITSNTEFTGTAIGMKALGEVFGITFNFGFYQAVMAALGIAVGPLGWIAVTGIFIYGGQKKWNNVKQTRLSFVIMALIIEYQARLENSAAVYADGSNLNPKDSLDDLGVLTKITDARYLSLPEHK